MPATSWNHRVGPFTFQFWEGDRPNAEQQQVETFQRAGVQGAGFRLLGQRGTPLDVTLTEHFASRPIARAFVKQYETLIGVAPVEVWCEGERLLTTIRTLYAVLEVREVACQAHILLKGPGYNYAGGAALITRWKLLPIAA